MIPFRLFSVKAFLFLFLLICAADITAQINIASSGAFNGAAGNNLFSQNTTGATQMIHNFAITDPTNATQIVAGEPGKLYGLVTAGGPDQSGGIFSINEDGSNFKLIFNYPVGQASMEYSADGKLYLIITQRLYRIGTDGTGFTLIADLPGSYTPFTLSQDGWIYGSKRIVDTASFFKIKMDGTGYQVLHSFSRYVDGNWEGKQAPSLSPTGRLYGTCEYGGTSDNGTFFSLKTDGSDFNLHYSFAGSDTISNPLAEGKVACSNGKVFFALGSAYKIVAFDTVSGLLKTISFADYNSSPKINPIPAANKLMGYNHTGLYSINQDGTGFLQLETFSSYYFPLNSWIYSSEANLVFYLGYGGVYKNTVLSKINLAGSFAATVHNFGNVPDGYNPDGLIKGSGKTLYGITTNGGATGGGTIYRVNQDGTGFLKLHDFTGDFGQSPAGQLLLGKDGRLYGVCSKSGINGSADNSLIYSIDTTGTNYDVLRTFNTDTEGQLIFELTEGNTGILYGTTRITYNTSSPKSIIFKINKNGTGYVVLKNFNNNDLEGRDPLQAMIYYNGYLYGVCAVGGQNYDGVIFRISETGSNFSVVHHFKYDIDGSLPIVGLFLASNNKLYGTTLLNGPGGAGTIFSLNPANLDFTLINSFSYADGFNSTRFIQGSDGRLYTNKYDRLFSIDTTGNNPLFFMYNKNAFYSNYMLEIDASNNSCEGGNLQYTSGITGTGYTYQWQVNNGTGFTNLVNDAVYIGVSNSTLQLTAVPSNLTGNTYRCAVNTGAGIVYTNNYSLNFQNIWSGATDTDWNKAANWSCGTVPGINSNVVVPPLKGTYPTISVPVKCKSVSVQKGATLTVATGVVLELTGNGN